MLLKILPISCFLSILLTTSTTSAAGLSLPEGTIIDLSYSYDENTVYWPTAPGFNKTTDYEGITEKGYYYSAYSIQTAEHGGTHLDAPIHFSEGQLSVDQLPLKQLMGPAVVVDVSSQAASNRDYQILISDFETWEMEHGRIPTGSILLLRTGFGQYWPDLERYMGTSERGPEAVAKLHFPGLHPDAARWLVEHRSVNSVGLDTPSIDFGQSSYFESHRILFAANIPVFENLAQLDKLPNTGAVVIALPMKIAGGSGGPLRAVAIIP